MDVYDLVKEGFLEDLSKYNIEPLDDNIYWAHSYSQGDGLCFDFKIDRNDSLEFLKIIEFANIIDLYKFDNISIKTVRNSFATYYCHEKTRDIAVEIDTELDVKDLILLIESYVKNWYICKCQEFFEIIKEVVDEEE